MAKSIDEEIAEALGLPIKPYSTQYQYARDLPPKAQKQGIPIHLFERPDGKVDILTFTEAGVEPAAKGLSAQDAPMVICEAILKFARAKKVRAGLVPGMCPKCATAMDDHNNDCPTCGGRHCDLETCPEEIDKVLGSKPPITDPNATPYKCKSCGKPRATWDEKRKLWRPPPVILGKPPICQHCGKSQKTAPPEPQPLKVFIQHAAYAWCLWSEYKVLCTLDGNEHDIANVRKFVNQFVVEMRTILHHYLILRICALVDDSSWSNTNGDETENLSIDNLIETLTLPAPLKTSLATQSEELKRIVKPLLPARNRVIAHTDKTSALANHTFGAMPDGAYDRFFELLEEMVNAMHAVVYPDPKVVGQINYVRCNVPDGPVYEMLVNLRHVQHYLKKTGKGDTRLCDL